MELDGGLIYRRWTLFIKSVETVFTMLILISIGIYLSYIGWITKDIKDFLVKLIIRISIPALTIYNFFETLERELITVFGKYIIVVLISMLILYIINSFIGKIIKIKPIRSGSFVAMGVVSNSIFFGLPVSLGLFGDRSIPFVLLYYIGNTIMFWGLCGPRIMKDGDRKIKKKFDMKKIMNGPLITLVISMILLYLNYTPPRMLISISKYLSSFVTPLALLVIGKIVYDTNFKAFKFDKSILIIIIMRFILAPFIMFTITSRLNLSSLAVQVFTIQSAMPVMTQTVLVAEMYGADSEYAATSLSITTLLSLFFIPLYMVLLQSFI